ncbi:hypothetical protein Tco_0634645 [Tanacetum coccineum]
MDESNTTIIAMVTNLIKLLKMQTARGLGEFGDRKLLLWKNLPSYIEGEPMQIVTATKKLEDAGTKIAEEEHARASREILISTIIPITRPNPEIRLLIFLNIPSLDILFEVSIPYEIHGRMCQLTNDEIQAHLDKEEKIKKVVEEAKLLTMSKPELIKVVHEEASNVEIDPKVLASAKGGQEFKKIQDVELKVLNREHS